MKSKKRKSIFDVFRDSNLVISLALLILFVSCEPRRIIETNHSFDFSAYNKFMASQYNNNLLAYNISSVREMNLNDKREVIDAINLQLGIDMQISDENLQLFDLSIDDFINQSLEKGFLTQRDLDLADSFREKLTTYEFDVAFDLLLNEILNYTLTNEEFEKYNASSNIILSLESLEKYDYNLSNATFRGNCWWELTVFLLSFVAMLAGCVTIVLCLIGLILALDSLSNYDDCVQGNPPI